MSNNNHLIGLAGMAGCGKDTIAEYLREKYGYRTLSFADKIKDCVSMIFGWERELLSGKTEESRIFRETIDSWWSSRLNFDVTPRKIMQLVGTESFRSVIHEDIWVAVLERYYLYKKSVEPNTKFVITDVRFPNEFSMIRDKYKGFVCFVNRGKLPEWYDDVVIYNYRIKDPVLFESKNKSVQYNQTKEHYMENVDRVEAIHPSERSWVGQKMDYGICNDSDLISLYKQVDSMIEYIESNNNNSI